MADEPHEALAGAIAAEAIVTAGVDAPLDRTVNNTPLKITRAVAIHANSVSRAVDPLHWHVARAVGSVATI